MKKLILLSVLLTSIFSQNYIIDDYDFQWNIMQIGDVTMRIYKNEDKTVIKIKNPIFGELTLNGKEAFEIADVLSQTNDYYSKIKNNESTDVSEKVNTKSESYTISFRKSEKTGFSIAIKENGRFVMNDISSLKRKEALELAPYLKDASNMINYVNQHIAP